MASAAADSQVTTTGTCDVSFSAASVTPGVYYVCLLFNAATEPTLLRSNALVAGLNANTSGATLRFAVNGTAQTVLPSSFTLSGNSVTGTYPFWVGLS